MGECKTQIRPLSSENEIELIAQISSAGVNEFKHFSIRLSFFSHKERIKLEEIIGILHFISSQDSSPTPPSVELLQSGNVALPFVANFKAGGGASGKTKMGRDHRK